ncbi:MAG: hypothetical protein HKP06_00115 [Flavobacteriaceae bacterium]|nr:hypothetical protein [Flavobacteriaceae bacterium]
MHIYNGQQRRQVGGGIWSTVKRGIRPLISSIANKLKPHALNLGKKLVHQAIISAANVGTSVAGNIISGEYKNIPATLKRGVQNEADTWTTNAQEQVKLLKRKYLDEDSTPQEGRGRKRRKMHATPASNKKKRKTKRKHYNQSSAAKRREKVINKGRISKKNKVPRRKRIRKGKRIYLFIKKLSLTFLENNDDG